MPVLPLVGYDCCARFEYARLLGIFNHCQGYAVFHAATRIEIFKFDDQMSLQALCLLNVADLQQRSLADKVGEAFGNVCHIIEC